MPFTNEDDVLAKFKDARDHDILVWLATKAVNWDKVCNTVEELDEDVSRLRDHEKIVVGVLAIIGTATFGAILDLILR